MPALTEALQLLILGEGGGYYGPYSGTFVADPPWNWPGLLDRNAAVQ